MKPIILLYIIWYLLAYPLAGLFTILDVSILGEVKHWRNNFYSNELTQNLSILTFALLIQFTAAILTLVFYSFGKNTKFYKIDNIILEVSKHHFLIPIILFSSGFIFWSQYINGWAIHGLRPMEENYFSGIGLTVLIRDLIVPLLFILATDQKRKYYSLWHFVFIILMICFSFLSLSKVTFVVWFLVGLIFIHRYNKYRIFAYLSFTFFSAVLLAAVTAVRVYFLRLDEPTSGQMMLENINLMMSTTVYQSSILLNIDLGKIILTFSQTMLERILGFRSLASGMYHEMEFVWFDNFHHYFFGSSQGFFVEPKSLIGNSTIRGGFGVDYITVLYLVGPYSVVFFVMLSAYSYCTALLQYSSDYFGRYILIFSLLILIRYLIDGNLNLFKDFTILYTILCSIIFILGSAWTKKIN